MKKTLLTVVTAFAALTASAAVPDYDQDAALLKARADVENWMSYLPDDVFVAHVSIPGTHDAATGEGWVSSSGPTYSTTQAVTIDEQLKKGVRAFDFRPGLVSGELWCNHGTDQTKLKLADAFTKLTNYLDAHPGEFFVIHLFRGNVPNAGTNLTGGANSDSDREDYNRLINELFNVKLNDYIVDYSPKLTVGEMRGKMVVFRRDRISFAHIAKAGNLWNWPGDEAQWYEGQVVSIENASDKTIKGLLYATDISSPDNAEILERELTSLTDLFAKSKSQPKPNDAKREGSYKPYWVMPFTSGCYGDFGSLFGQKLPDKTTGYEDNATYTNPHFTKLLRDAQADGTTGPAGTVFSDWVLVDVQNNKNVMGVDLIPAIYENNFYYIKDFILDDELFNGEEEEQEILENIWDESKTYYMRNVATGQYLCGGLWYGTHAALREYGLRITPVVNQEDHCYYLNTELVQGGVQNAVGDNTYVDNFDSHAKFKVTRAGGGKFIFSTIEDKGEHRVNQSLKAESTSGWLDGVEYNVVYADFDKNDPYQQWELIETDIYYKSDLAKASNDNPVDLTYRIGRYMSNGPDNGSWAVSNKGTNTNIAGLVQCGNSNHKMLLQFHNNKKSTFGGNTKWTLTKNITGLPAGIYELKFDAYMGNHSDATIKINGVNKTFNTNGVNEASPVDAVNAMKTGDYTLTSGKIVIADNGTITFVAQCSGNAHGTAMSVFFDNFKLLYYGPDPTAVCERVQKYLNVANGFIAKLPEDCQAGWEAEIAPIKANIETKSVSRDGDREINEIYSLLRKHIFANKVEGADFTGAIINNSFQTGEVYGWDVTLADQVKVVPNSDGTYTVNDCDDGYLFNSWQVGVPLMQTINDIPSGKYRLQAKAVTGDTTDPRYVFLIGNGLHSDKLEVSTDKVNMTDVSYDFDVLEDGMTTIGFVGANEKGDFIETGGWWYKVDNFRLTYLGEATNDAFLDRLRQVIEATTALIPEGLMGEWNEFIAPYVDMVDNKTLEGDGSAEINEIYAGMQALILSQEADGSDLTAAIFNNDFEQGETFGWSFEQRGDTGVRSNDNDTYHVEGAGKYVFNTYDGNTWGAELTQTLPSLAPGLYRVEADLTSDGGNVVSLLVNDERAYVRPGSKTEFEHAVIEIVLTEEMPLTIGAKGVNCWYKADNFRLTRVASYVELDEALQPVTSIKQLVAGATYVIAAVHPEAGHHVMGTGDKGHPAFTEAGDEAAAITGHVAARIFVLDGTAETGWTLTPQTVAEVSVMAIGEESTLTISHTDGQAAVVMSDGMPIGFNAADKTFGTSDAHAAIPATIYTAAYDETNTGVDDVIADRDATDATYYNLQGVRIDRPAAGTICIRVAAGKATKVIVK